ncbi:hypothetical protein BKA70DRAFT_1170648, partial [Coprinopsis sp. MPI-PUGE-AT-0042]
MALDDQFHLYANSNDALPKHLQEPLYNALCQLNRQRGIYERERLRLTEAINSRQSMVEALEREIEAFESARKRIIGLEDAVWTQRNNYAATVSAIRRIPPEVVASIIHFAIKGRDGSLHQKERLFFAQIRSVCRLWRATSFSTPSLWRSVGLDIGEICYSNPQPNMKTYLSHHLTSWFLRAGDGEPITLIVYGPLPNTVTEIIDFFGDSKFNIGTLAFFASRGRHPHGLLPYYASAALIHSIRRPLPVKNLTFEFRSPPHSQPPFREITNLAYNFPNLSTLSVVESVPPTRTFPINFAHGNLVVLHLDKVVLAPTEMPLLLSDFPRLQKLHLQRCEAMGVGGMHASFIHQSLRHLVISNTVPEALLSGLTFPVLESVVVNGPPSRLPYETGDAFSQFLQRCGGRIDLLLSDDWPMLHVLNNNFTIQ